MASSAGVGVGAMGMGALNVKEGGYDQMNAQLQNVTLSASETKKKTEQQAKEKLEAAAVHAKLDKSFLLRLGLKAKQHTTIEDLEHLELRRSAIMKRAHGGSSWEVATQWDGTAVKWATKSMRFYITAGVFGSVRAFIMLNMLRDQNFLEKVPPMDMGKVAIIGAFHSLFLVFFASQSYSRFGQQYSAAMAAESRLYDICGLAAAAFKQNKDGIAAAHRLFRHVNAVHLLAYVGLSSVYTQQNFLVPFNEVHQLMSPAEMARIKEIDPDKGAHAYREAMGWALRDVVEAGNHDLLGAESTQIRSNILSLRASLATLYDFHAQPVPFFYVHLITMISGIYLPLFAYGVAIDVELTSSEDAFTQFVAHVVGFATAGVTVAIMSLSIIGLQEVGRKLGDPFGDDMVDLSVMSFVTSTLAGTRRQITCPVPESLSVERERILALGAVQNMVPTDLAAQRRIYQATGFVEGTSSEIFSSREHCLYDTEEVKAAALKDPKSFPRSSIDSYFASFTANKRVQNPLKEDAANDDDDTGVDDDETE